MSGSRTRTGCWTCRIRRKKCDEMTPSCSSCISRGLCCHGYGQKPAWMLGKGNWQQILDSDEAKAIRNSAERAYSRERQKNKRSVPWSTALHAHDLGKFPETAQGPLLASATLDRTWSDCTQPLRDCDYTPNYHYIQTFLDLIFPLQWGFFDLNRQPDRRWLFDMIVATEPMYHVSFGMCLSFESGLKAGSTSGQCDVTPEVQASRLRSLRGLQPYILEMQQDRTASLLPKATRAVAVILLLTSLEVFGETEGAWEVHQNAAGTVLDLIETRMAVSDSADDQLGPIGQLLSTSTPSFEARALEFFVTTYAWADVFAEAAHGGTYTKPRAFNYLPLLRRDLIDTRSIMGCDNSVMVAIKEVNLFAILVRKGQQPDPAQTADILTCKIRDLLQAANSKLSLAAAGSQADSSWVTLLHAYGALIYVQTVIIQEGLVTQADIQEVVTKCLDLLEALHPRLFIRVCWPFTVAGCMASEGDYSRFRAVVKRVEDAGHVLGNTWKGLMVMEECWRLRAREPDVVWCWRTAMEHMRARILLI